MLLKSATVAELKCLPELTRKDLNLIARSGCAEQLTAAAGDSQRVQELLAQLKAEKSRADTAEAHLEAAHADISGLKGPCHRRRSPGGRSMEHGEQGTGRSKGGTRKS